MRATLITAAFMAAALAAAEVPVKGEGVRLVAVGNSQTHPQRWLAQLSALIGHPGYKHTDISILGASMRGNYQHPELNKWPERLKADGPFDAIIVYCREETNFESNVYAVKWLEEVLKTNPQCRMFIQQGGPVADQNWENPPWEKTEANAEWIAAAVAAAHPEAPRPCIIPESLLRRELGRLADRGELPGVASRYELMGDGGHLNEIGQYGLLVLTAAMLYQESPFDYPADIFQKDAKGNRVTGMYSSITVPPATAAVIRRVAWDILQTYPPSGIRAGLIIASRRLDPFVAGQPVRLELKALNAAGPGQWRVSKGPLPPGLALSPQGVLTGQCDEPGDYPVTVEVADGANTAERPLVIAVAEDTPPVIPDQSLATIPLDQRAFQALKVEGGVGRISWSLGEGRLPYGVMLMPSGILVGSPGEAGTFTFSARAIDSHPAGPRTAEKALTWTIGPLSPSSLAVRALMKKDPVLLAKEKTTDDTFAVDGRLDESFWSLDQPIERKAAGAPTKQAVFGAVWTTDPLLAKQSMAKTGSKQGRELLVGVKVLDGPKGRTPRDGIHLYLDARHDGTHTYAADDLHFFIPRIAPANTRSGTVWIAGKVNWFITAKVAEIDGGYTVEASLGSAYFTGEGNWLNFGGKGVYGFDLGVEEGTDSDAARQVWRGDGNNDTDTSHFGTIVLAEEQANP